ncbi:hypothetical protein GALMADRAFT_143440 [Galerina marginata CBS 339.88]|uniref:Uncharacterized protein n=1 Tax=Galerina marginata (strain CBS 339.88) TaxID=685588 RepID=A0A067SMF0_GALM3|nr:hypothetical protein GALMADRAFT_143440 [Galerina marginata CBS 339.88]
MSISLPLPAPGSVVLANGLLFQPRVVQSQATCAAGFTWMQNAEAASPCLVTAEINAVCNGGDWNVPALSPGDAYSVPDSTEETANFCTCSWASYNLISACTVCQGLVFSSTVVQWVAYSALCDGKLSDEYFPSNATLPPGVTIPFWAAKDPTQWSNGIFNMTEAKKIADQNYSDLEGGGTTQSPKTSNIIVPVVGGVIGGSVFIAVAVAIAYYVLGRQRQVPKHEVTQPTSDKPLHIRSISDITTHSGFNGHTILSPPPLNQSSGPTIMTHSRGVPPIPYFSSVGGKTAPQGTTSLAPSRRAESPPPISPQRTLEPFNSPSLSVSSDIDKMEAVDPVFDPPSAQPPIPLQMEVSQSSTPR